MLLESMIHAHSLRARAGVARPRSPLQLTSSRRAQTPCRGVAENFDHLLKRKSDHGTPIVDWLLETNKYAPNLTEAATAELRERELSLLESSKDGEQLRERVRRLRIAMANKGRTPWNMGKKHKPGALAAFTYYCHLRRDAVQSCLRNMHGWQRGVCARVRVCAAAPRSASASAPNVAAALSTRADIVLGNCKHVKHS